MTLISVINKVLGLFPERWPIPKPISAVAVVSLTLSINLWVGYDKGKDFVKDNEFLNRGKVCNEKSFDYVIVGGGTAGMIVATRLANASTQATVLVLEAGGEPSILNDIPVLDVYLSNQPGNTFVYRTSPQHFACGLCDDRRSLTTSGKLLGGSSSVNFMMYVRGNQEDYNRWAAEDASGDLQWSYKELLPYFRKSEDYNGAHFNASDSSLYHGRGGLLNIASPDYMPGIREFLAAAREKGYKIGDYNGANQEVFSPIDVTTEKGWRESTYRAFYRDSGKPPNLCIRKYAEAVKIHFERDDFTGKPRAVGVTYSRHKSVLTVLARKEVILSAGVYGSAKLLLLSSVGPKNDLDALNIPCVMDLPVGRNLQDHVFTVAPFLISPSLNPNRDLTPQAAFQFLHGGRGALAAPAGLAGTGFLQSPFAQPKYPDLQIIQLSLALDPEAARDLNRLTGLRKKLLDKWFHPHQYYNTDARFLAIVLGRPKSVGLMRLASKNPYANPIIDPKLLEHPDDVEALLYGFKKVLDLYENSTSINKPLFPNPVPGCENFPFKSDPYLRCVIRQISGTFYHPVGTNALGKVVDNSLKVKGIEGLRIIDASVIPRTPNGNTLAATVMIAEKGADLIIQERQNQFLSRVKPDSNFI